MHSRPPPFPTGTFGKWLCPPQTPAPSQLLLTPASNNILEVGMIVVVITIDIACGPGGGFGGTGGGFFDLPLLPIAIITKTTPRITNTTTRTACYVGS